MITAGPVAGAAGAGDAVAPGVPPSRLTATAVTGRAAAMTAVAMRTERGVRDAVR
ncbi:hypothetical protein ACYB2S_00075 [Corynebacterium variabile]|uniref:hypothetical protein n=1 Tax=Corynebacterium variabile TaxID=1727 RepID=UPI003C91B8F7